MSCTATACAVPDTAEPSGARAEFLRPDERAATAPRFDADDAVETYASLGKRFVVHFAREGDNAVPALDADKNGTPDFVETAAASYEEALAFYVKNGFRAPLSDAALASNGGDGRFDVYLVDFGNSADGAFRRDDCVIDNGVTHCIGHMVQDNDFSATSYPSTRAALRTLASHELFHAVQAAYNGGQTTPFVEGTAVWASEAFDPSLDDLDGFAGQYFESSERSLAAESAGPADGFAYGSGVFYEYLDERFGRQVLIDLFEALDTDADAQWDVALQQILEDRESSLSQAFFEFADWSVSTGSYSEDGVGFARAGRIAARDPQSVALPFLDNSARMFRLATRAWKLEPGSRSQLVARIVATEEAEARDLQLTVVSRARSGIVEHATTQDVQNGASIAIGSGISDVVVLLSRGGVDGPSVTPGVCIGSSAEVAGCVSELTPDAGLDAEVANDAGVEDAAPGDTGPAAAVRSKGCGVSVEKAPERIDVGIFSLLTLAGLMRRRPKRTAKRKHGRQQ